MQKSEHQTIIIAAEPFNTKYQLGMQALLSFSQAQSTLVKQNIG